MWECGTLGQRIGLGSTWDSSSISGYTLLQIHGEMNIQFPEMLFFVAEQEVVILDLSESNLTDLQTLSREGDMIFGD